MKTESDSNLQNIRKKIFANGVLNEKDVETLMSVISHESIDRQKADFLFEIKDTVSRDKMHPKFKEFFVDVITAFLLEDEESPGEIEESEARWLRARIQYNGKIDDIDEYLLKNLRTKSINFPQMLNYKGRTSRIFENVLFFSRYLSLLAVIGSILSAIAIFIKSSILVATGLGEFCLSIDSDNEKQIEHLLSTFVTSVDMYLFAMVLVIFGMGIYELFINKIDPVERKADSRPAWLQISSIDELKSSLGRVILLVLIVSLFKHSLTLEYNSAMDLLHLAICIILVAGALFIAQSSKKAKKEE